MNKLMLFVLFLFAGIVSGQDLPVHQAPAGDRSEQPKMISGGVLNGKAIELPKPTFPPAANAVGAQGAVSVQVLVDEEGNVAAATAVSGHPLLRAAAVEAARGAKFTPTKLMGNPVKVSGIITYNFVGALHPARLGFAVGYAERSADFRFENNLSLASRLPVGWAAEKVVLMGLTFEAKASKLVSEEKPKYEMKSDPVPPDAAPKDPNRFTIKGDINYSGVTARSSNETLDARSVNALRLLIQDVQTRYTNDQTARWVFDLGVLLGVFTAEIGNGDAYQKNLSMLESHLNTYPPNRARSAVDRLDEFVKRARSFEQSPTEASIRNSLVDSANQLSLQRY